jgi:tripartite-type tricarboxylate transporter receptor subunit TctC
MKTISRAAGAVLALFAFAAGGAIAADSYPSRPVRVIVPYTPGGGSDITTRSVGQKLGDMLQQTFVIDNRPGAGSMIGAEIVAKARPDGYTLLVGDPAITINSVAQPNAQIDAVRDFIPVGLFATTPHALLANPSFSLTLKDVLALPKAESAKLAMGTTGQGPYMTYEWLRTKTGLTLNEVPYKSGAPAMTDALAGQIPLLFTPVAATIPYLKSGKLKGLAITTAARHPLVPDLPTFRELGVKELVVAHWYGLLAPVGTPQSIVLKLNRGIVTALESPDVRERFAALALDINPTSLQEFRMLIDAEMLRWKEVVAQTKVRAQ